MPGATQAERSSSTSRAYASHAAIRTSPARASIRSAGDARLQEHAARDVGVRAAGHLHPAAARLGHPVHDAQRLVDRVAVRVVGPDEQRAVDVEEQQHVPGGAPAQARANDVSALSDCANAAMSFAHASMSSSWTISTDECM